MKLRLHDIRLTPTSAKERSTGLLGYVRVDLGDVVLDGLALRRTRRGDLRLTYPRRTDPQGKRHLLVEGRGSFEAQVLASLGLEGPVSTRMGGSAAPAGATDKPESANTGGEAAP